MIIVFTQDDGSQARIYPADGVSIESAAAAVPQGKSYEVATNPPGRNYRWANGAWATTEAPAPLLSKVQWRFFLNVTGFKAIADAALAGLPKTTPEQISHWAGLEAVINNAEYYRLSVALSLVAGVRAQNLPGVSLPSDAEITAAWMQAAGFSVDDLT